MGVLRSDRDGRVRAGWRLLAHALLVVVLGGVPLVAIAQGLTVLHRRGLFLAGLSKEPYDMAVNMIVGPVLALGVFAATAACGRWLDRRRLRDFGLALDRRWWTDWAFGLGLGAVLMGLVLLAECALGWAHVAGGPRTSHAEVPLLFGLAFALVKEACVGPYEELFSRGYQMRNLAEGLGARGPRPWRATVYAMLTSSALFAALHVVGGAVPPLALVGLFAAGMMYASAAVATGQLGLPIGLHMAWNLFQGAAFGMAVSGGHEAASLLNLAQHGPAWAIGGTFGPEGGVVGIAAALLGTALVRLRARPLDARPATA